MNSPNISIAIFFTWFFSSWTKFLNIGKSSLVIVSVSHNIVISGNISAATFFTCHAESEARFL